MYSRLDPKRLSLAASKTKLSAPAKRSPKPPRRRGGEWFIRAIPGDWIAAACALGGRALRLALAIWCEAGMKRTNTVRLTAEMERRFSVCRAGRGLAALERAGLIRVARRKGSRPQITIQDFRS